jgi:predicted RNase H-like HicB family nuclease
MLEYHAAYYRIEDGWYLAKILDFPGAISQGRTLKSARRMIRDSLVGLAEFILEKGEPLPRPNLRARDSSAAHQEPIRLAMTIQRPPRRRHEKAKATAASSAARVRL